MKSGEISKVDRRVTNSPYPYSQAIANTNDNLEVAKMICEEVLGTTEPSIVIQVFRELQSEIKNVLDNEEKRLNDD